MISDLRSRVKYRSSAGSRARRRRFNSLSPLQNWICGHESELSFGSSCKRPRNDDPLPVAALARRQALDLELPGPTVPGNDLSQLLFTGNSIVGNVPDKTITLYNNADQTIFPFLYDANNGFGGGPYDPFDAHGQEYRLYVGHQSEGSNYFGLEAHSSMSFTVPLVFWDSGRIAIATDGNNLLLKTNG